MKHTVKLAKSFIEAAEKATVQEVVALGVKGWVIVNNTHPLLKSVRHFTRSEANSLGEKLATQISKQPFAVVIK